MKPSAQHHLAWDEANGEFYLEVTRTAAETVFSFSPEKGGRQLLRLTSDEARKLGEAMRRLAPEWGIVLNDPYLKSSVAASGWMIHVQPTREGAENFVTLDVRLDGWRFMYASLGRFGANHLAEQLLSNPAA